MLSTNARGTFLPAVLLASSFLFLNPGWRETGQPVLEDEGIPRVGEGHSHEVPNTVSIKHSPDWREVKDLQEHGSIGTQYEDDHMHPAWPAQDGGT